ncbi:YqgE/AlgH family protein [Corallococcus interemptor]|uniref:YqgE/AlgH family protein n=1 Tax=Corallococcus TaxID=83461 RepID=UPI0005B80DF5|nr:MULTISPECIES: YqgE/AlgH family protein [Corallococcus]MBN9687261.1 YqgE/AlgH family protein [Corallococcus sp. NCSPR001]MBZ4329836.1 YqgE/AlgH family protein [Corallococcus sp. AS-1-12]MBZ4375533.1 YqgE/AlgH family protein [Corallococcus sp. AS-1-6]RKG61602.1 YqgE/AlgH family protein [Corallococcus sp. CA054B]WAS88912.1 YqgE/AlgH family protein [Corallococcus sp. NCRR]
MKNLASGFLLAMPQLGDPNFYRSVILMIEHGETGSMGLVVNRGAPLTLGELARGQSMDISTDRVSQPVFVGGPVEPQRGFVLHDDESVAEKHSVLPGLYLSVTLDALGPLLQRTSPRVRFCLGYAGWGPKQLENEIAAGSWLYADATADAVLGQDPAKLWDATLRGLGVDPAMLVMGKGMN